MLQVSKAAGSDRPSRGEGQAFAGAWFTAPTAPMLFVQGTADTWNPQDASLQLYQADRSGPRYYLDLSGADHFTPYEGDGASEPIVARVTIDFLDHYLAGYGGTIRALSRAGYVLASLGSTVPGRLPYGAQPVLPGGPEGSGGGGRTGESCRDSTARLQR